MTNDNQHISSGYKPSPLGIIPEDWEVKRLSTSFVVQGGYAFKSEEYQEDGIPIIRISNLPQQGKYVNLNDCVYCNETEIVPKQYHINKFDLLIAMSGATTGKVAIFNAAYTAYLNQRVGLFKQTSKEISYNYLTYLVTSDMYDNQLRSLLIAGAQPNIAPTDIEQLRFPIPSIEEQNKIADILSLWDTAIVKQTALIEQLTLRKRGLMQQLLTGKKRLKGFEGEWKEVKLGEVCEITTGKLDANAMVNNGTYPFYTCAKEVYRINEYAFDTEALLVSGNGEHVGYVHYYKGKFNAYQRTYVLDGFIENIFYIYYALNQYLPKRILQTKSNSNTPYIVMETLANMELLLPEDNEQKAIAKILMTADKEIEIQKQKLAAMQEQKKGLMQVLLTGKKRIKL